MLGIGEFSRATGLTVKALRLYHQECILVPSIVDRVTGYRYYDHANVETARVVALLRQMLFPLDQIKAMLAAGDDGDALTALAQHRVAIEEKLAGMRQVAKSLDALIAAERAGQAAASASSATVQRQVVAPAAIASLRVQGVYADAGKLYPQLLREHGGRLAGKPFSLFHDGEHKDEGADFECCVPVKKGGRELPGGVALTLVHEGPYSTLGRSYAKLFAYAHAHGFTPQAPSREVYLQGPGMNFRGNPKRYLTEIQIFGKEGST
jgi:DNA-binding transcriptional MerR regulator